MQYGAFHYSSLNKQIKDNDLFTNECNNFLDDSREKKHKTEYVHQTYTAREDYIKERTYFVGGSSGIVFFINFIFLFGFCNFYNRELLHRGISINARNI